ncbi:MAG: homocysteine S-methyltransferase family protein [Kiritimatiellae bacterium]|nr:homocysteine S-methyltransferase family protein [Kiritimatiellia bacterium]
MELRLKDQIYIGDGALGTRLQELSGKTTMPPESANLDAAGRELVGRIHEKYIEAGARIIETNTFAANFPRLERFGLGKECERINTLGAEVARSAAAGRALVAGSVGPLDLGVTTAGGGARLLETHFRSQMKALKAGGVDLLMLETFSSPSEARAALQAAGGTDLPVFFSIGGQSIARPYARKSVLEMIAFANRFKPAVFGVNCLSPYDLGTVLKLAADNTDLPLLAYPNAGTPSIERGLVRYDLPAAALVEEARKWLGAGVVVFGGCCGTGPEHIRALAGAFKEKTPGAVRSGAGQGVSAGLPGGARPVCVEKKFAGGSFPLDNPVRAVLHSGKRPLIAVEVRAALSRNLAATVAAVKPLADCGIDFFNVPDNPAANPARDCMACAFLLQQKYKIPAIIHKAATQANALHVSSYLLGAADLGIRGVLAVTGDPPGAGAFDRVATRVNDLRSSIELLRLIALLREGALVNGQSLPEKVDLAAGCAFAHGGKLKSQTAWLAQKVEAGAEFVFTQPVFAADDFGRVAEALAKFTLKKFFGVMPLLSLRQAEFVRSGRIPGITVPPEVVEEIARYPKPEDQLKAGMGLALALVAGLAQSSDGIYLIMPFHKNSVALTADLARAAGRKQRF